MDRSKGHRSTTKLGGMEQGGIEQGNRARGLSEGGSIEGKTATSSASQGRTAWTERLNALPERKCEPESSGPGRKKWLGKEHLAPTMLRSE